MVLAIAMALAIGGSPTLGAAPDPGPLSRPAEQGLAGAGPVVFLWAGALAPTSIRVSAKLAADSVTVRLLVSEEASLAGARVSTFRTASAALNNRIVSFVMKGLDPGTSYHYGIESEGTVDVSTTGQFTTPTANPLTYSFAFSSCAETGSNHPVFDTIRGLQPLFFAHIGDMHYENIAVNDPNLYRAAFDTVLASPAQSALYRAIPIDYMWDDHDYGPNNGDATSPGRLAARLTYQEYLPHYPLVAGAGNVPIYHAFSIGRVRFIVTDSRSERTPYLLPDGPTKTMLGAAQLAWLESELLAADGVYPVIVWVNTLPWIGTSGDDGWYTYTHERRAIADFLKANTIQGLYMISGDAHMIAIDDGTNSDYATGGGAGFPVMHAAALDRPGSVKGGPYSHGAYPGGGQFGLMTILDDGASPVCVSWSGRDEFGAEIVGFMRCAPSAPPSDTDGDGVADLADCDFADPGIWAQPADVTGVGVTKGLTGELVLAWTGQASTAGPSAVYDVVGGLISELRPDGDFRRAACVASSLAAPGLVEPPEPLQPGEAAYRLVRAASRCGSGGYGHTSTTDPRLRLDSAGPCELP